MEGFRLTAAMLVRVVPAVIGSVTPPPERQALVVVTAEVSERVTGHLVWRETETETGRPREGEGEKEREKEKEKERKRKRTVSMKGCHGWSEELYLQSELYYH
jgi:hypothetical protein